MKSPAAFESSFLRTSPIGIKSFFPLRLWTSPWRCGRVAISRQRRVCASAGWRDAVFGFSSDENSSQLPLEEISSSFPTTYGTLHLLGLCSSDRVTYATFQTNQRDPAVRATYAVSSQAFPIPHMRAGERFLVHDAFKAMYDTPCPPGTALTPASTAFAQDILPSELVRFLGVDVTSISDAASKVLKENGRGPLNRVMAVCSLLQELRVRVTSASLEEVASVNTTESTVCLSGFLFVEREISRLYGEIVYTGKSERVRCDPGVALSIANAAAVPCYMRQDLFEAGAEPIRDMLRVFAARGEARVEVKDFWGKHDPSPIFEQCGKDDRKLPEAWELKAEDVLAMTDDELRRHVSANGLPTVRGEDRNSLLRKLVDMMDEVERREMGIQLAAENELYGLAGEMQAGRSKRGQLLQELREAERNGMWSEVVRLGQRIRTLESQIADITAEPGSYSPYLDQDEWYKPNR